jgi:hypothetical protein
MIMQPDMPSATCVVPLLRSNSVRLVLHCTKRGGAADSAGFSILVGCASIS